MSVIRFPGATKHDLDPNLVLEGAHDELTEVLVLGWHNDESFWFGGSDADLARALVLLKRAERYIIDQVMKNEP